MSLPAYPRPPQPLLLYEARIEGHHLSWLRFVTEDLLEAGVELVLALDQRPSSRERIEAQLSGLLARVKIMAVRDQTGWIGGRGQAGTVALCQRQAGVEQVFLCCFDEIASPCLRRAAFGVMPPGSLRGKMGGIYIRPRFLAGRSFSPNSLLKRCGFHRLLRGGWFQQLLFLDEYLHAALQSKFPAAPFYFLPDTCPPPKNVDKAEARRRLGLPQAGRVVLFYGGPYRRKGLDLAVSAMEQLPSAKRPFLLCLGQQPGDAAVARGLELLAAAGCARSTNRYVSPEEEELGFAASDAALLPYRKHFGSSNVLTRAAATGLMVIASDEELIGRRVREHKLGLLFPPGQEAGLRRCLEQAAAMTGEELAQWSRSAKKYSASCTRSAFRQALLVALGISPPASRPGTPAHP